jgi:biotin operon repressor
MNTEQRNRPAASDEPPGRTRSAEIILIPKQLRAEWMDVMAADRELSPIAYKVAGAIGSHFNRHTGDTFVSQETLAEFLGFGLRTVQKAVGELEARGYLIIKRRELGRRSDGRRVCGGRGVANVYLPAFERSQVAVTERGRRFAERIDEAWQRTHERASIRKRKDAPACVLSEGERTQKPAGKDAPACVPTLGNPTDYNPTRGRASARDDALSHPLGAAAEGLRKKLGAGFETWFGKVTVLGLEAGTLRLGAPSGFVRDYLQGRHEFDALQAWNEAHGRGELATRVDFVTVGQVRR